MKILSRREFRPTVSGNNCLAAPGTGIRDGAFAHHEPFPVAFERVQAFKVLVRRLFGKKRPLEHEERCRRVSLLKRCYIGVVHVSFLKSVVMRLL